MKTQSLKLFVAALVLGMVGIFAAGTASAQSKLVFETPFDFQVGGDRLAAGRYELQRLGHTRYLLRSVERAETRIVFFDLEQPAGDRRDAQQIVFHRYGETYFLNGLFDRPGANGKQMIVSRYEKNFRRDYERENRLAKGGAKPEKVSLKPSK